MPTISYPGIYIEETGGAVKAIEGVATSTAAFVGHALKAPRYGTPMPIDSLADFERKLGGPAAGFRLYAALAAWFANGGRQAVVLPVGPCEADVADPAPLLRGIRRIGRETGPSLLLAPDALRLSQDDYHDLVRAMLRQCARRRDRFAILDIHGGGEAAARSVAGSAPLIAAFRAAVEPLGEARSWGAAYYSWLIDPSGAAVPPSAAVAGLIARFDRERGVWKAAAGLEATLRASDVAVRYADRELQEMYAPPGAPAIDPIRRQPSGGICVWGGRTLAAEGGDWRYVPVRRTAIYIERSIDEGTQWAVFEPNEPRTWLDVHRAVETFLHVLFRQGAFQGATPREAFYVKCGLGLTMTQDDIGGGRLIIEIGFAPLKPAEFVVLRISQLMRAPDE